MLPRQHCCRVGADLVRGVAVRRDPVGADDDRVHPPGAEERSHHAVGDEGHRDPGPSQFPRSQPGALEQRPGLGSEHLDGPAGFGGRPDDAERGAVAAGGEHPGVAVGQEPHRPGPGGQERLSQSADLPVRRHLFGGERVRFGNERGHRAVRGGSGLLGQERTEPPPLSFERRRQIHRRRARRRQQGRRGLEVGAESL